MKEFAREYQAIDYQWDSFPSGFVFDRMHAEFRPWFLWSVITFGQDYRAQYPNILMLGQTLEMLNSEQLFGS